MCQLHWALVPHQHYHQHCHHGDHHYHHHHRHHHQIFLCPKLFRETATVAIFLMGSPLAIAHSPPWISSSSTEWSSWKRAVHKGSQGQRNKKETFEKGFTSNWTEELFTISNVKKTQPVTYELIDTKGEKIKGSFYEQELQKTKQEIYRIEKVLRKRKRNGVQEVFVKWKGYNNNFNSWIPLTDFRGWISKAVMLGHQRAVYELTVPYYQKTYEDWL